MNKKLIDMFTMAGAVVLGFVIHKLVANFLGMPDATETFAGASGRKSRISFPLNINKANGMCDANGSAGSFQSGSPACNYLWNCQNNGGTGNATGSGSGSWSLTCVGADANMEELNVNNSGMTTTVRPTTKKFF